MAYWLCESESCLTSLCHGFLNLKVGKTVLKLGKQEEQCLVLPLNIAPVALPPAGNREMTSDLGLKIPAVLFISKALHAGDARKTSAAQGKNKQCLFFFFPF